MNAPQIAAQRFGIACLLGCLLGIYYGFLRPLRPRWTALSDLLFVLGTGWVWIWLGFVVCRGDLRLGYTAGLALGGFAWELTAGKWIRPVFGWFWKRVGNVFAFFIHL